MFGYLRPVGGGKKADEIYRKEYCSLCHALWHHYGFRTRFTLSYDMTFAAVLLRLQPFIEPERERLLCYQKKAPDREEWKKLAALSLLMTDAKLSDDRTDERSFSAAVMAAVFRRAFRKAKREYPETDAVVAAGFQVENEMEKKKAPLPALADAFADVMVTSVKTLFELPPERETVLRYLSRWVYWIDAVDDLEEDLKKGRFNPFYPAYSSRDQLLTDGIGELETFAETEQKRIAPYLNALFSEPDPVLSAVLFHTVPAVTAAVLSGKGVMKKTLAVRRLERKGLYLEADHFVL